MDGQNYLGIYISKNTATAVCLGSAGRKPNILGCFSVSVEETEGSDIAQNISILAGRVAQTGTVKGLAFSEVTVALDSRMFMQHNVHSEFTDTKQISATVRFDTEEAIAADISDVALAFTANVGEQTGSDLTVFTAKHKILSEIIISLQNNKIDPVSVEPDVNCLSRFICQAICPSESEQIGTFFGVLSGRAGYFVLSPKAGFQSTMRTFLLGPAQDRSELLAREIPLTTALIGPRGSINRIKIFNSDGSVDCQQLTETLGIETTAFELAEASGATAETLTNCDDHVNFAIAYGAALAHADKMQSINFRNDFMPYMGRKMRLQKTLKVLSISLTILILALGMYFQAQMFKKNKPGKLLRNKFSKEYSDVMLGKKLPSRFKTAVKELGGERRRIENVKKGLYTTTGEKSISAKVTMVLEAFNKCASKTSLKIDKISVSSKNIRITGSTSSRKGTRELRKALKDSNLTILQDRLETKGKRDNFSITIAPRSS